METWVRVAVDSTPITRGFDVGFEDVVLMSKYLAVVLG